MVSDPKDCKTRQTIELNLTPDKARVLYRRILNSRDAAAKALCDNNLAEVGFYIGWLDSALTELSEACPNDIKAGFVPVGNPRVGGGDKP